MTNSISNTGSTTKESAQSKKCNLLKLVRNDPTKLKLAKIKLKADALLQQFLTVEMLEAAARGEMVTKAGSRSTIKINLDDYDDNGDLIKK